MADYDFRALSPIDFEDFARDLLNADGSAEFVTFAIGPDGGVDLRDSSVDPPDIAQCKHRPDASKADLIRDASSERVKLAGSAIGKYWFVTTAAISPGAEDDIAVALAPLPATASTVWHRGRLNTVLTQHPEILQTHFKLWLANGDVLVQILQAAEWQRSEALLARVADRLRLYVTTPAFAAGMSMLAESNVVVITGAPGVGKSTLAEMILLNYWHDGWRIVNATDDLGLAWAALAKPDEKVLIYCDDFLGQTDIAEISGGGNGGTALLLERVKASSGRVRLVMTTRDQVLAQARVGTDDRLRRLNIDAIRSRVDLGELSRLERAKILFNHLHFGIADLKQRDKFADDVRYLEVIDHPNFNPRIVESATLLQAHSSLDEFYEGIKAALDNPEEIWAGSFAQLSSVAVQILMQLALTPTGSVPADLLRKRVSLKDPRSWTGALRVLEGSSWVAISGESSTIIGLFDPSRRDFLLGLLCDESYLEFAVTEIKTTTQLRYLTDLGTGAKRARSRPASVRLDLSGVAELLNEALTDTFDSELREAREFEREIEAENLRQRELSDGRVYRQHANSRSMRLKAIENTARVSAFLRQEGLDQSLIQIKISDETLDVLGAIRPGRLAHAAYLIDLVTALWDLDAIGLEELCKQTVTEAARLMEGGDDLDKFGGLPRDLLTPALQSAVLPQIERVFEEEVEGIEQQSDADLVDQWISELVVRADEWNVTLYTDSLYEFAEELRQTQTEGPRSPAVPHQREETSDDQGDESIARLFARLRE